MASIKYPTNISSNADRYAYLYRLQELLRLEHNKKSADLLAKKISESQWLDYESANFDPKSSAISTEIGKYRELLKKDTKNAAKLSDIVM